MFFILLIVIVFVAVVDKYDILELEMIALERVGVVPTVEKMAETRLRWFEYVERRPVYCVIRRVDQMEGSHITRDLLRLGVSRCRICVVSDTDTTRHKHI